MSLPSTSLSTPALTAAVAAARDYLRSALAEGTGDVYRRAWQAFEFWCRQQDLDARPAEEGTVVAYLAAEAERGIKPSSLAVRRAAIAKAHKTAGLADPTAGELVTAVLKGIRREAGSMPTRKTALVAVASAQKGSDLHRVLEAIPEDLAGLRDRALILIGFAAALRRSELTALTVDNLETTPNGLLLHIRRSKTDQEGRGQVVAIPPGRRHCPLSALQRWLKTADIREGPVFRAIRKDSTLAPRPLEPGSIARIVKRRVAAMGLDPARFSGHSLRSGFLTSAAEQGASIWKMAEVSRHKSLSVLQGYVQRRDLFQDHAAGEFL